jgi:hypothetical protein
MQRQQAIAVRQQWQQARDWGTVRADVHAAKNMGQTDATQMLQGMSLASRSKDINTTMTTARVPQTLLTVLLADKHAWHLVCSTPPYIPYQQGTKRDNSSTQPTWSWLTNIRGNTVYSSRGGAYQAASRCVRGKL